MEKMAGAVSHMPWRSCPPGGSSRAVCVSSRLQYTRPPGRARRRHWQRAKGRLERHVLHGGSRLHATLGDHRSPQKPSWRSRPPRDSMESGSLQAPVSGAGIPRGCPSRRWSIREQRHGGGYQGSPLATSEAGVPSTSAAAQPFSAFYTDWKAAVGAGSNGYTTVASNWCC